MRYDNCPIEINSDLQFDPNYVMQDPSAFSTNEYSVQFNSYIYDALLDEPDYTYILKDPRT